MSRSARRISPAPPDIPDLFVFFGLSAFRDFDIDLYSFDPVALQGGYDAFRHIFWNFHERKVAVNFDQPDRATGNVGLTGKCSHNVFRPDIVIAPGVDEQPDHARFRPAAG